MFTAKRFYTIQYNIVYVPVEQFWFLFQSMLRAPKVVLHILALKTQAHPIHISVCLPFLISPSIYFLLYPTIIGNGQKRVYLSCVIVIERGVADTAKYNYLDLIIPFEFFFV